MNKRKKKKIVNIIMNNKSEEEIQITIMILNTLNNDLIQMGREYNITMKRGTMIEDLFNEFVKCFSEEIYSEIKKYSLWSSKKVRLFDTNKIEDAFSDSSESDLNIMDKNENIFHAIVFPRSPCS